MRIIKLAVISVVVIFIILTAMSSLLPSHTIVSRAVDIRGSAGKIKQQVFALENWHNWLTDAKGEKAAYILKGNTLQMGETKITPISISDSAFVTLWTPGNNMVSTIRIIDHHSADSLITVQWQIEQKVKWYPWEKFASITNDEVWGGAMEKSLDNLRSIIEPQ